MVRIEMPRLFVRAYERIIESIMFKTSEIKKGFYDPLNGDIEMPKLFVRADRHAISIVF